MTPRRVWVKRSACSATLVSHMEDAVVDELRDQVILKYANSLGREFDSPDIVTTITPRQDPNRQAQQPRLLNPDEMLSSVLDTYYPGGQTIEEALVIDVPTRYNQRPSPHFASYSHDNSESDKHGDSFPFRLSKNALVSPPHPQSSFASTEPPSRSVRSTDIVPSLLSPGSVVSQHTLDSPVTLCQLPTTEPIDSSHDKYFPAALSPTAPVSLSLANEFLKTRTDTSPAPAISPRSLRTRKNGSSPGAALGGLIDGTVPPINVLIVEDNIINQRLLEAFMKRLNVRWKCAANGEEAVRKWRQGGFHFVLMDIQLPIMDGLAATREIRRLERLNGIGVFPKTGSGRSSVSSSIAKCPLGKRPASQRTSSEEDTLGNISLFRSPVVIVALTASSLQSDRHGALAAGCNDFLTKPVRFPWLEQKVTEWGCMQALTDFEGWRRWRGFIDSPEYVSPTDDSGAGNDNSYSPMHTDI
ncbi:hypothetical protein N7481_001561 [Penicillium waksmanii]|uniref:uncharacterized protein n=1 Tax=Penicillium waksmanii TaxID=69791 RepID=UPI002548EC7D|nr:uncharacterized protein N7481_001561 [Penicillium waksmanii]KAJ6001152.1 hypothetical protein N7481_001561 [Penicillium waksmanii]